MTATRDRDSDLDTDAAEAAWDERPVFGSRRGLPWWAAVLVALLLSVAGAVVDGADGSGAASPSGRWCSRR